MRKSSCNLPLIIAVCCGRRVDCPSVARPSFSGGGSPSRVEGGSVSGSLSSSRGRLFSEPRRVQPDSARTMRIQVHIYGELLEHGRHKKGWRESSAIEEDRRCAAVSLLGIAHSGRLHRRSRGICGGGSEPKNLSHFDMTINDVILGSIYHSIQYFLHPRFQQMGTKRLHVGKRLV